ncbi:PP2C family protein-serine/threonine phosphatase [Pseudokineococcus sp. 1T1Z-3]|uniref:PP2C family protein-serine/threonine phosphatase n=1 Tax=Pseudokineococcus sp. 1T1Z-3 TaxID=3132745 RepID=UPI0030A560A3
MGQRWVDGLPARAGALSEAYAAVDWAATPLGDPAGWDATLRRTVDLALATRFPVTLLWGPELVLVYNESYVDLIGDKHPAALGARAQDVFPEAWDVIGPMLHGVLGGAGPTWTEDVRMPLARAGGRREECYFTFSYSPVRGDDGSVVGVVDITAETTRRVVDRRRLELLARLTDRLSDLDDPARLAELALPVLRTAVRDLPDVDLLASDAQRMPVGRDVVLEGDPADPSRRRALLRLPGVRPRAERPVLVTGVDPEIPADDVYLQFLVLLAGVLGTAYQRALATADERAAGERARSASEALQRGLLTALPQPDHLELVARYQPAASELAVGGDWYDAFPTADGGLSLVVGDVSGHDVGAAVAMSQVRGVLRGIGHVLGGSPAATLSALDQAMHDLAVGALATAVLVRVGRADDAGGRGGRGPQGAGEHTITWSAAGHPPAVLVHPDGRAELLSRRSDLLLGLAPAARRSDHTAALPPGATLVLYTDGLVERRRAHLSEGLEWLRASVERLAAGGRPLAGVIDTLLAEVGAQVDDDVVVLAVRAHPEDRPRPPEAGPEIGPDDLVRD